MIDLSLKIILALITLGLGFSINLKQISTVFSKPKPLILGLFTQMVLLPLLALCICILSPLSIPLKIGIIIISLCPGGTTSNLLSYLFKANLSLSISLTTINGIITLVSIPLLTKLAIAFFTDDTFPIVFPIYDTVVDLILIIILPVIGGVVLNYFYNQFVSKIERTLTYLLPISLALVFGIKLFAGQENGGLGIKQEDFIALFPYLMLLNLLAITGSFLIAHFTLNKNSNNSLTIAIETGLQNTALALIIAQNTGNILIQQPAAIYAGFSFFSTLIITYVIKKAFTK